MRGAYRVLAFIVAAEVVIQAMAIAYALAGLGYWVSEEGGVLNKAAMESEDLEFTGIGGFILHGINGMMVVPILALLLLIVSFFAKLPGASKRAGIILGMVVLQVVLGISTHSIVVAAPIHVLNGFGIFAMAALAGYRARTETRAVAEALA